MAGCSSRTLSNCSATFRSDRTPTFGEPVRTTTSHGSPIRPDLVEEPDGREHRVRVRVLGIGGPELHGGVEDRLAAHDGAGDVGLPAEVVIPVDADHEPHGADTMGGWDHNSLRRVLPRDPSPHGITGRGRIPLYLEDPPRPPSMADLPDKSTAFMDWYLAVVEAAGLTDKRYPVKGMNVWTPYGFRARAEPGHDHDPGDRGDGLEAGRVPDADPRRPSSRRRRSTSRGSTPRSTG